MCRRPLAIAAVLTAALSTGGCSYKQQVAAVLVSDEQEEAIGLPVKQELQKQGVRYLPREDRDVRA